MRPAVVAGHVCIDLVPELSAAPDLTPGTLNSVGRMQVRAGGCVANTGRGLAELGAPVRLFADAGDDELGRMLNQLLTERGADTGGVRLLVGAATSYSIVLEPAGADRCFLHHVGANAAFDGRDVDLTGADLLHLGYPELLPAIAAADGQALRKLLQRARDEGVTTSLDLATTDPATPPGARAAWRRVLDEIWPLVDIATPSADDLAGVYGRLPGQGADDLAVAGHRLIELGAAVVVVTAGEAGMCLVSAGRNRLAGGGRALRPMAGQWADQQVWAPATTVEVVTTLGAGDAAAAGLLYGVLAGLGPIEGLLVGTTAAALRVGGCETLPPYRKEQGPWDFSTRST